MPSIKSFSKDLATPAACVPPREVWPALRKCSRFLFLSGIVVAVLQCDFDTENGPGKTKWTESSMTRGVLTMLIEQLNADPMAQLAQWIADATAAGIREPNAMALATATPDGRPSVRIVLAKGVVDGAVQFYTNYESRKGRELLANAHAAVVFHWVDLGRQVRVEGKVSKLSAAASAAYFASRPRGSQLAAWASQQSRPLAGYGELEQELQRVHERFGDRDPVPCPPHWGGFVLRPESCEFWLNMPSRMHDRVGFERRDGAWHKVQLAP